MEEFDLDLVPFVAPLVRINTPEGTLEIRCDLTHPTAFRYADWFNAYQPFMRRQGIGTPPSLDELFEMTSEATRQDIAVVRGWGSMACMRLMDFLGVRFFTFLATPVSPPANGTKPSGTLPASRSRRTGRSR